MKIAKRDYEKFYVVDPDSNFNGDHNKRVVENSIKKYEKIRENRRKTFRDGVGERSEAVASFLKSRYVDSGMPIDKYLGKRMMTKLRGEQIIERLKMINSPSAQISDIARIARSNPTVRLNAKKK